MIKPIGDKLVVELDEADDKTASGIIIPGSAKEKLTDTGVVVSLGSAEFQYKLGDKVIFNKYAGTDVVISGKKCSILTDFQIIGVFQ